MNARAIMYRSLGISILLVLLWLFPVGAAPVLNYQGRILVNGAAHNGSGYFKFALVDPAAAETFWTSDETNVGVPGGEPAAAVELLVSDGLYAVLLGGAPMPALPAELFAAHEEMHLRVWFSTAPGGPFELLAPDRRLAAVGYAFHAQSADGVTPGYDVGDSNSLELGALATSGALSFEVTFTQAFTEVPELDLGDGWTVESLTETGFTASASFVSRPVDTDGVVGTHTSVAEINGLPAVAYRDAGESALMFARAGDALGTEWPTSSIVTIDGAITNSGEYASLAQVAGRPAVSYYHGATGDLRFARAGNAEGSTWPASNVVTVDGLAENVGWHTSLAVVGGVPAIAYYAPNAGELRYAWAADAEGADWPAGNVAVVDGAGALDRGRHASLIELGGKPAIAFHDATNADLVFAWLSGSDPGTPGDWTRVTVDSAGAVGEHASLALVDGRPAIAYYDAGNGDLKYARAGDGTGAAWPAGTIMSVDGSPADCGSYASLAVVGGRPAIAYHDATNGDLKFAWSSDAQGGTWPAANVLTVAGESAEMGAHASMAAVNGMPAIAFHEGAASFDLRFASLPPATWSASAGEALPVLASGVKDGAVTSRMLSPELGVWRRSGNDLYYDTGKVGIGRVPAANALEVEGSASKSVAGNWAANSDRRIKTDVEPVDGALETLQSVRLVSFRYTGDYLARHPAIEDRRYLNVIAQEFAQVFPEHVRPSGEFLPDGSEILEVDTYPLTIYAAAAVQELNRKLDETQSELAALRERLAELEEIVSEEPPVTEK